MDNYTQSYLRNHCVDFFFTYNNLPIHVLTDGCLIPNSLCDVLRNRKLQHEIALASERYVDNQRYDINFDYIRLIQQSPDNDDNNSNQYVPTTEDLIESHAYMSQLGFFSYACVWNDENEESCRFVLVTSPKGEHPNEAFVLPELSGQFVHFSEDMKELVLYPYLQA